MINQIAFTIFGLDIYWYGIIITLGAVLGFYLALKQSKKLGYDTDYVYDFLFLAVPLSIVFARIYYIIFEWEYFAGDFFQMINIRDGGIAIYGALIGGVLAALIFTKIYKKPRPSFLEMLDIFAPSFVLGQAIGRWGNFVNQEAYSFIKAPDWMRFPLAVYIEDIAQWRLATFFYESLWDFFVFLFLIWFRKQNKHKNGDIFFLYIILYSFGRMFIEGLRADSLWLIPNVIRVSQLLAFLLVLAGIGLMVWNHKKDSKLGVQNGLHK